MKEVRNNMEHKDIPDYPGSTAALIQSNISAVKRFVEVDNANDLRNYNAMFNEYERGMELYEADQRQHGRKGKVPKPEEPEPPKVYKIVNVEKFESTMANLLFGMSARARDGETEVSFDMKDFLVEEEAPRRTRKESTVTQLPKHPVGDYMYKTREGGRDVYGVARGAENSVQNGMTFEPKGEEGPKFIARVEPQWGGTTLRAWEKVREGEWDDDPKTSRKEKANVGVFVGVGEDFSSTFPVKK